MPLLALDQEVGEKKAHPPSTQDKVSEVVKIFDSHTYGYQSSRYKPFFRKFKPQNQLLDVRALPQVSCRLGLVLDISTSLLTENQLVLVSL